MSVLDHVRRLVLVCAGVASFAGQAAALEKKAIDGAISRGVDALRKMQREDGSWKHSKVGATALAGLTLLECGADGDDRAVQKAAAVVRAAALTATDTYSLSLSVLFLARLDQLRDTPLVESMLVRLLAGQTQGGWSYDCPPVAVEEMRRIKAEADGTRVRGGRDFRKLPPRGRRKPADLPREIQAQLQQIARGGVSRPGGLAGIAASLGGDNSNTQFATMALWVGRGYGVPTQGALLRVDQRFRTQQYPGGGWSYVVLPPDVGLLAAAMKLPEGTKGPTATMTCAGLLGLAAGHGANLDVKKAKNPRLERSDVSKDAHVRRGLQALATAVGTPVGWSGRGKPPPAVPVVSGKGYYFLWSLERVAVAFNLETLGTKDWYRWGAEALLASQEPDGTWRGEYADCGADTCFALLFLKRVNFAPDLPARLAGGKLLEGANPGIGGGIEGPGRGAVKGLEAAGIDRVRPKKDDPGAFPSTRFEKKPGAGGKGQ